MSWFQNIAHALGKANPAILASYLHGQKRAAQAPGPMGQIKGALLPGQAARPAVMPGRPTAPLSTLLPQQPIGNGPGVGNNLRLSPEAEALHAAQPRYPGEMRREGVDWNARTVPVDPAAYQQWQQQVQAPWYEQHANDPAWNRVIDPSDPDPAARTTAPPMGFGSSATWMNNPEMDALLKTQPVRPPGKRSGFEGMNYTPDDPAAYAKWQQDLEAWQQQHGAQLAGGLRGSGRLGDIIASLGQAGAGAYGGAPRMTVGTDGQPYDRMGQAGQMTKGDGRAVDPEDDARTRAWYAQQGGPPPPADWVPPQMQTGGAMVAPLQPGRGLPPAQQRAPHDTSSASMTSPLSSLVRAPQAATALTGVANAAMKQLRAPNGLTQWVPDAHVDHYMRLGASPV